MVGTRSALDCRRRYYKLIARPDAHDIFSASTLKIDNVESTTTEETKMRPILRNCKRWSAEDDQQLIQWIMGSRTMKGVSKIAETLGRSESSIRSRLKYLFNKDPDLCSQMLAGRGGYLSQTEYPAEMTIRICQVIKLHGLSDWKVITMEMKNSGFPEITEDVCINLWKHVPIPNRTLNWSLKEDNILRSLVEQHKPEVWRKINELLPGRVLSDIIARWNLLRNSNTSDNSTAAKERLWKSELDRKLVQLIQAIVLARTDASTFNEMTSETKILLLSKTDWVYIGINLNKGPQDCKNRWKKLGTPLELSEEVLSKPLKKKNKPKPIWTPATSSKVSPTSTIMHQKNWDELETKMLVEAVQKYGLQWQLLAEKLQIGRTARSLSKRWSRLPNSSPTMQKWETEDDVVLLDIFYSTPLSDGWLERYLTDERVKPALREDPNEIQRRLHELTGYRNQGGWTSIERWRLVLILARRWVEEKKDISKVIPLYDKDWLKVSSFVRSRGLSCCVHYVSLHRSSLMQEVEQQVSHFNGFEEKQFQLRANELILRRDRILINRLKGWLSLPGESMASLVNMVRRVKIQSRKSWWMNNLIEEIERRRASIALIETIPDKKIPQIEHPYYEHLFDDDELKLMAKLTYIDCNLHALSWKSVATKYFPSRSLNSILRKREKMWPYLRSSQLENPYWQEQHMLRLIAAKNRHPFYNWNRLAEQYFNSSVSGYFLASKWTWWLVEQAPKVEEELYFG